MARFMAVSHLNLLSKPFGAFFLTQQRHTMRRITAAILAIGLLASLTQSASPVGLGRQGTGFGKLGSMGKQKAFVPPPSCGSPTAPNGQLDLSQCSNAFYVAVVF
jgi:hypothetical protein